MRGRRHSAVLEIASFWERDSGQTDLLRARLNAIIDMGHALGKLARTVNWPFLGQRFGAVRKTVQST